MPNLILKRINDIISQISDKNYREYIGLLFKYGSTPRNQKRIITFYKYKIEVPDFLSFIFQYKDIFVKNIYKFNSGNNSPLIYDCGANIGISCLYFKELFPSARIKAFEADPAIANILSNNLRANKISGIDITAKAVWTDNNGIDFNSDGADGGSITQSPGGIRVDSVSLRNLLLNEEKIDLIKMDIEGAEVDVIIDCNETLKIADKIFIEFHSWMNNRKRLDLLLKTLHDNGFSYFIESISNLSSPLLGSNITGSNLQLNIFATNNNL
ncbi:MAG: FkbM family methyltransferase [Ignavibacteriaceae bacterium]